MKLLIVVGARPNFMKAAPILKAIRQFNSSLDEWAEPIAPILVHTGQHYDAQMSDAFFADLQMPQPDVFLAAGSGSHAAQTAEIMKRFEPVLIEQAPDSLLVVGDVNSTLACALVAAKLPVESRPLIAHIEAGLRSFDRSMPEEINRILTDQISDLLFVTEDRALKNLHAEGIPYDRIHFVGNTMMIHCGSLSPRPTCLRCSKHSASNPATMHCSRSIVLPTLTTAKVSLKFWKACTTWRVHTELFSRCIPARRNTSMSTGLRSSSPASPRRGELRWFLHRAISIFSA